MGDGFGKGDGSDGKRRSRISSHCLLPTLQWKILRSGSRGKGIHGADSWRSQGNACNISRCDSVSVSLSGTSNTAFF